MRTNINKQIFVSMIFLAITISSCNKENKAATMWKKMHDEISIHDKNIRTTIQEFNVWVGKATEENLKQYTTGIDTWIKKFQDFRGVILKVQPGNDELNAVKSNYIKGIDIYFKVADLYKKAYKDNRTGLIKSEIEEMNKLKVELEKVNNDFSRLKSEYITKYKITVKS
ncbi:hypothetical protein KKF34_00670 [Myxococcota bacterium]|nr:hypothetical protein [Myxococcota bacterium]MBU1495374.1 hypothetical protein [Myxococcota bacterium]